MIRRFIIITIVLCAVILSLQAQDNTEQGVEKNSAGNVAGVQDAKDSGGASGNTIEEKKDNGPLKTIDNESVKGVQQANKASHSDKHQEKNKETKTPKKKEEKKAAAPSAKAQEGDETDKGKEDNSSFNGQGLLLVDEGDESIRRIPGIVITKSRDKSNAIVQIPADVENKSDTRDSNGLFGMSSEKTETVAKVAIVILIFIIFLLYRMRSRTSGRRVVRTFPKK